MGAEDLKMLFDRYLKGACTREEIESLLAYFHLNGEEENVLQEMIGEELGRIPPAEWEKNPAVALVLDRVQRRLEDELAGDERSEDRIVSFPWRRIAAAVMLLGAVTWTFYHSRYGEKERLAVVAIQENDVLPGGNKASLILADGSVVNLSEAGNGQVATQSGIAISKIADGELAYEGRAESPEHAPVQHNTLSVPKGGQFKITLPDGTRAWLNAASTLRFPTQFETDERRVILTGEGYFEVSEDRRRPFFVASGHQVVQVVGTHFNVKAYEGEEETRTTLLEGSVYITRPEKPEKPVRLLPGQQAITAAEGIRTVSVDAEQAVAWKNGLFNFQDANLKDVMHQLERWYDVEVDYTGMPDIEFVGTVPRTAKLSSVLKALELTSNIEFRIDGKKIRLME